MNVKDIMQLIDAENTTIYICYYNSKHVDTLKTTYSPNTYNNKYDNKKVLQIISIGSDELELIIKL